MLLQTLAGSLRYWSCQVDLPAGFWTMRVPNHVKIAFLYSVGSHIVYSQGCYPESSFYFHTLCKMVSGAKISYCILTGTLFGLCLSVFLTTNNLGITQRCGSM